MATDRATRHRALTLAVIYVAAYLLLEWASNVRPQLTPGITPWNPQAGLTLAFLLLVGPRWWPLAATAAFAAALTVRHVPLEVTPLLASSLWIGMAYGILAALLRRWGLATPIRTMTLAARLAMFAIVGTLVVAAGYVGLYVAFGEIDRAHAVTGVARYWVADLNAVVPLASLLIFASEWRPRWSAVRRRRSEIVATLAALALMLWITFLLPAADQLRFFYLMFLPIIWIALRWRWPGAMLAVLAIQVGLLVVAESRIATARFIDLQFLMFTLTLTGLLLGAVVAERERAAELLRERDAALARAMRFAMVGELASALAHELNQPITALVSYLRASEILARGSVAVDDRLGTTLGKAVHEGIRASQVLHRLRDFYRGAVLKTEPLSIAALCNSVRDGFQEQARRVEASLVVSVDPATPTLQADSTQVEIVLHNLVANALDAVAQAPQPRQVRVEVTHAEGTVKVRVEDSGPGIGGELAAKLFEPFVTTKPDGMGLGLAISRSLIRGRGGELAFEPSTMLGGAAFVVVLPIVLPEDAPLV